MTAERAHVGRAAEQGARATTVPARGAQLGLLSDLVGLVMGKDQPTDTKRCSDADRKLVQSKDRHRMRFLRALPTVCAVLPFALSGCIERWEKPGATPQEFDAMKASCISRAYARFPPRVREIALTGAYTAPIQTSCSEYGYNVACSQTGGQYIAPITTTVDDNQYARNQDTRACFYESGWQPAENP